MPLEFAAKNVRIGARAADKEDAIRQVGQLLVENHFIAPGYIASMLEREKVANTYLGKGIAIPHGLPQDRGYIEKTGIAVLQLPEGVDWQPSSVAGLVVGIAAKSDEHLDLLAKLTGLLFNDDLIGVLAHTPDADRIVAALVEQASAAPVPTEEPAWHADALRVEARVGAAHGLHARPATAFVEAARGFESRVGVLCRSKSADGKSLAALLQLGADHGEAVTLFALGPDAQAALDALKIRMESAEAEERLRVTAAHGWAPAGAVEAISGIGASPGLAIGRIYRLPAASLSFEKTAGDPAQEKQRLADAIARAVRQLGELREEVRQRAGESAASVFLAHREFVADSALRQIAEAQMDAGSSAAWAWQQAVEEQAAALAQTENALLAARAVDLRDAGARVLRNLAGGAGAPAARPEGPLLLIARELTPSETAALDPARVVGFCTAAGGPASHAAIIARSLGIPAVVGAGDAVLQQAEGAMAILDADGGTLYVNPAEADLEAARMAQQRLAEIRSGESLSRFEPAITTDGTRVEVCANIGRAEEASAAVEAGGEGVGLMRSEFLFLGRGEPPSEDEQYAAYRQMVEALGGLPLVLRTLDIGGDKSAPYIAAPHEENPFLGVRGIRLCLQNPELFRTQLRAAYRASVHGSLKLMFPMIATLAEMREARKLAEEVRRSTGVPPVKIGCMIEVPSAVMMARELAREVDFFSIGTNDLTQYTLAMDRGHPLLARQADGLHPAVLRMIEQTAAAATAEGKPVAVCGGLAGDPTGALILIGLGVTELSMAIPGIAAIKSRIRAVAMADARELARRALQCEDAEAVRRLPLPAGRL